MNPFEMVVAIIFLVTVGSVLKARYGIRKDANGNEFFDAATSKADAAENARLREELRALRDRVQVLERVVTETEGSVRLDREIEALRDRR